MILIRLLLWGAGRLMVGWAAVLYILDKGENQAPCEPDYLSIILASAQNDYDHPIRVIIRPDLPMLSEVDQATWVVPAPK